MDCLGSWGTCGANCFKTFSVTQLNPNGGTACTNGDKEEAIRNPGEGNCPGKLIWRSPRRTVSHIFQMKNS